MESRGGLLGVLCVVGACASAPLREAQPPPSAAPLATGDGSVPVAQREASLPRPTRLTPGTVYTINTTTCVPCTDLEDDYGWGSYVIDARRGETYTVSASAQSFLGDNVKLVVYPVVIAEHPLRYTFTAPDDGLYLVDVTRSLHRDVTTTPVVTRVLVERGEGSPDAQAQLAFAPADDISAERYAALQAELSPPVAPTGSSSSSAGASSSSSSPASSSGGGMDDQVRARMRREEAAASGSFRKVMRMGEVSKYKSLDIELTGSAFDNVRVAIIGPTIVRDVNAFVSFVGCPAGTDDEVTMSRVETDGDVVVWGGSVALRESTRKGCVTVRSAENINSTVGVVILY